MSMRFSVYQESYIGGRKNNQDRMGYSFTRDALLLVLADGMGGHLQGEMAATIAVQTIAALFQQSAKPYVRKPERFLEESLQAAHREIHRYRALSKLPDTPRTTIVACLIQHNGAYWAHCGDSRLYWMRGGKILARTRDHSRVEALIAEGKVQPSERFTHPGRNKLFNCLGAPTLPVVELSERVSLLAGDVILLCSDGLWGVLPDDFLAQELQKKTVVRAVPELLAAAAQAAGKTSDNVTALALTWQGGSERSEVGFSTIVSEFLPAGSVTTNIQAARHADLEDVDVFSDNEIEKAIEEIRGAIEKSTRVITKD